MKMSREATELKHYFEIRSDLTAAVRDAIPSVTEFHLNELVAMGMHTTNGRLRRACIKTVTEHHSSLKNSATA